MLRSSKQKLRTIIVVMGPRITAAPSSPSPSVLRQPNWTDGRPVYRRREAAHAACMKFATASYYVLKVLYRAYFGPLIHFPGPHLRAITGLPSIFTTISGKDHEFVPTLHKKYDSIVRLAPNELSFSGGAQAWADILGPRKGALPYKDPVFHPRNINGVNSLMTAGDEEHRRQRKIMAHAFSERALKGQEPLLKVWVERMKNKLAERAAAGEPIDTVMFYNCEKRLVLGRQHVLIPVAGATFDIMCRLPVPRGPLSARGRGVLPLDKEPLRKHQVCNYSPRLPVLQLLDQ